ncbi:unnamed protein product [Pleuronectes platessa]|uniref:Uncharacterized protein n=1 Tax=Pleuronectes platessa TaxID=8262 RepID=A0A9N7ULD9_PLEPL|nr:unnamed protein product [Pleuronectes platessa]
MTGGTRYKEMQREERTSEAGTASEDLWILTTGRGLRVHLGQTNNWKTSDENRMIVALCSIVFLCWSMEDSRLPLLPRSEDTSTVNSTKQANYCVLRAPTRQWTGGHSEILRTRETLREDSLYTQKPGHLQSSSETSPSSRLLRLKENDWAPTNKRRFEGKQVHRFL